MVARYRAYFYARALEHHRRRHDLAKADLSALAAQTAYWQEENRRLQALMEEDFASAYQDMD